MNRHKGWMKMRRKFRYECGGFRHNCIFKRMLLKVNIHKLYLLYLKTKNGVLLSKKGTRLLYIKRIVANLVVNS